MTNVTQAEEEIPFWERYHIEYPYGQQLLLLERSAVLAARDLIGEPARVFEVGCEGGQWLRLFAERNWQITCTDISAEALAICQRRLPDAQCLLVKPEETTLLVPDASQDTLLCIQVPAVLQSEWFIKEAARVLAPAGYLVGVHYNRQSLRGFLYNYIPGFRSKNDVAYYYYPESYAAWRRRLQATGFELIREDGFGWIPFRKFSRSPLIEPAVRLERQLGLRRLARFGAMVVFVARKQS